MAQMFPSMKDVYGTVIHAPKANDVNMYKEFSTIGHNAGCGMTRQDRQKQPSPDDRQPKSSTPRQSSKLQLLNSPQPLGVVGANGQKRALMTAEEMMQSTTVLIQRSVFTLDNSRQVMPPSVKRSNRDVYEQYVARANGPQEPSAAAMKKYQEYVGMLYKWVGSVLAITAVFEIAYWNHNHNTFSHSPRYSSSPVFCCYW